MAGDDTKTKRVEFRLTELDLDYLDALRSKKHMGRSEYLRELIRREAQRQKLSK